MCTVSQTCPTLSSPMDCMQPARLLCQWDFPGKNTGVCCHFFLQGIFPIQGSLNLHLLHWQAVSLPLSHQESPYKKANKFKCKKKKKIPTSFILFTCPPVSLLREAIPDVPPSLPSLFYFSSEHTFLLHVKQCSIHLVDLKK